MNFKCVFRSFCYVPGGVSLFSRLLFVVLICGVLQAFFFAPVKVFGFFDNSFPVITHGLDLFLGAYTNKFSASMVPSD